MNEVLKTIKSRRSIRSFKPEQLEQEALDLILEAAIYAPSGRNKQPWHFTVIQNRDIIKRLSDTAKTILMDSDAEWQRSIGQNPKFDITYGAPTLVIVSRLKSRDTAKADCAAAIQNMLLAADSLDIGSIWIGLITFAFTIESEAEKIGIPEGFVPYYGVAFGYRQNEEKPEAPRRNADVINYIK